MDVKEAYRVLGLEMGATRQEVVAAYRSLMRKWHPDRVVSFGSKRTIQEATRKSQAINEAYDYLKNIAPDGNFEASRASRNTPEGKYSKPEQSKQKPQERPAATSSSSSNPRGTQSENRPRNPEASRPGSGDSRSQAGSTSRSQPRPTPTPEKKSSSAFDIKFGHILFGVVAVTIILALMISAPKNLPAHNQTAPQTEKPANAPLVNHVTADTQNNNGRMPQIIAPLAGGILATINRANAIVEVTKMPTDGDARIPVIVATKKSDYERTLEQLAPGEYSLRARLNGWPEIHRTVIVEPGRTTRLAMEFKGGALRLQSIPSGAVVRFGDTILGVTPLSTADLPPGECKLSVAYSTWPIEYATVTIVEDAEAAETIRIPHGRLTIESTPTGASIFMNGLNKGRTPLILERIPVGIERIEIRADDYATSTIQVLIKDKSDHKIHPALFSNLKILDPNETLKDSWTTRQFVGRDYDIAPNFEPTNASKPQNGVVRNLSRPVLDSNWLGRKFRYSAAVKKYDPASGLIEFTDQTGEKSKYRVVAQLSAETRGDRNFSNRLLKGAVVEISGRLSEVEEPRWPLKTIIFQISNAQAVR